MDKSERIQPSLFSESANETKSDAKSELPAVDSPPLSPATEPAPAESAKVDEPVKAEEAAKDITSGASIIPWAARPRLTMTAERKQRVMLAGALLFTVGIGAVVGSLASGLGASPKTDLTAALNERNALQQSVTRLNKEIATLKTEVDKAKADLDRANKVALEKTSKAAHSTIAKIPDRFGNTADITGAIPAPAAPGAATVVPMPRPAPPRVAAADPRSLILQDWSIRAARGGYIYVEGHGEIYQVVPGAPLPGLGPVQSIRREDGRWVVVTPRGIIVANGEHRRFD